MKLTRRELEKLPRESIHRARNWSKADVSVAKWPPESSRRVVIKDLKPRPLWFRVLAGRYFLRREWRALSTLKDLDGVPKAVAMPDADAFVMEYMAGMQVEEMQAGSVPLEAITKIEALVKEMHRRGVTHGDLHGYNMLVDEQGNVALIDWATASVFGANPRGVKKLAFEEWRALDDRALAKVKVFHAPLLLTERERDLLLHGGSRVYRFVKKFKIALEKLRGIGEEKKAARAARQENILQNLNQPNVPKS